METVANLIGQSINWIKHPTNLRYYYIVLNGDVALLRLNNFPEEPLLTLIFGLEIIDIEDVPEKWKVPFSG